MIAFCLVAAAAGADPSLRDFPEADGPLEVSVGFYLSDVNEVDERLETFEFEAILTLGWSDPRLAFDPSEAGTSERVYQGDYQFHEIFDGWWPQLMLANESGSFERQALLLRVAPDGTATLVAEIHAVAEAPMQLRRFPFDHQDFEAVFELIGYERDRVILLPDESRSGVREGGVNVPQWELVDLKLASRQYDAVYADGLEGARSQLAATLEMKRRPAHMLQVVVMPLTLLVCLTFSVFWMDRESLGDRMDISFIGILSVVAYQIIVADKMPDIAYFTLMTGFLYSTYAVLAAGVVVNLTVSKLDRAGHRDRGNRIDYTCRWAVPAGFLGVNLVSAAWFLAFH